ncbi:hypothetical protein DY000_02015469 [Brassica cretica]|uniref:Retroviral aspartyl protease n=1 Tax=Brassica cretica TaxID=69181 RepID=A0ABQ7CNA5_BRACR|nr:hypothetical protein DY000_02015469 [Brassica cretica]
MKQRITLKKKSDPGKFAVPCLLKGIEFPCTLCDTGSSVSILPKVIADHLGLKIDPSEDSFTFVDYSTRNSGGIIRNLEVQIGNAVVPVDFHVMDNKMNMNHSLLLGRAFIATVRAVCNMQTNQLCLTLINPDIYYDPVRIVKPQTSNTGVNTRFIAACYCELKVEYETEYEASIDNRSYTSINSVIQPTIGNHSRESIDSSLVNEIFSLPVHCYLSFAVNTQPQTSIDYHYGDTISRQSDYSIGSWADDSHHERFAVDTELPEIRSDEYDEDYHIDKIIEYGGLVMDDRGVLHTSIADNKATSIDNNTKPVIDTHHTPDFENRVEDPPSVDKADASLINGQSEFRLRALHQNRKRKPHWEMRSEYSVISTVPEQATYRKAEVDELVASIYRAMRTTDDSHSKMLDDPSIDARTRTLIDARTRTSIEARLATFEDRLQAFTYRLDGVYYPLRDGIDSLTTRLDALQQEMDTIQRQLDFQGEQSPSTD